MLTAASAGWACAAAVVCQMNTAVSHVERRVGCFEMCCSPS